MAPRRLGWKKPCLGKTLKAVFRDSCFLKNRLVWLGVASAAGPGSLPCAVRSCMSCRVLLRRRAASWFMTSADRARRLSHGHFDRTRSQRNLGSAVSRPAKCRRRRRSGPAARGKSHAGGVTRRGAGCLMHGCSRNTAPCFPRSQAEAARNPSGDGRLRPSALSFVGGDHTDRHPPHSAPSDRRSPSRLPRDFYHGLLARR